jgi:hypothetical protein
LVDTKSSYSKEGASNGDEAHDFPKVCFLDVFKVNLSTLLSKFIYGEQGYYNLCDLLAMYNMCRKQQEKS